MTTRHRMVVFDCDDPVRLMEFWHALTGADVSAREPDWCSLKVPPAETRDDSR